MWKRCLPLIFCCFLTNGCLQTENSSSSDAGFDNTTNDSPEFQAAKLVFSQSCTGCHSFQAMTEAQLISTGRVVAGNAEGSTIYNRLQGSTGSQGGPKDMPQNGSIAPGDVDTVATWINGISP